MKNVTLVFLFLICISFTAGAQKCYIPQPMSNQQIEKVKGVWKGSYVHEGKEIPVTFNLYANNKGSCKIDTPPVKGAETGEQIRFCEGGEFHLKKYIGDVSYEFQGVPKDGRMQGILTIRDSDGKIGSNGRFSIKQVKTE